jgi:hypothetical protein
VAQVVAYAQAQLGQPYLYGGEGAGGFDCSGLMQAAFKAAGITLPRTAQGQYDAAPKVTAPAAGDLVFYGTSPSNVTHVGLYLGGGKMLDAPHTGAQVRIENVWSGVVGYGRPLAGGVVLVGLGMWKGTTAGRRGSAQVKNVTDQASAAAAGAGGPAGGTGGGAAGGTAGGTGGGAAAGKGAGAAASVKSAAPKLLEAAAVL